MRPLTRKLLRDLWTVKGQALAISLVIGAGVAMFVMYLSTFQSLRLTQQTYYQRYRFGDVFAALKRAPLSLRDRLEDLPGIHGVRTRVVVDVTLDVEDLSEPAVGRLIAIPVPQRPMINDLFLRRGRYPDPGRPDEVLASEAFAIARRLGPGDRVAAVINGRRRALQIVGVALSPEYVYSIRPGELIPDNARFGIFWMEERALAAAFDMEGGFNDVALTLLPGASAEDAIARLDRLLAPYGGLGAIPRALQISHWYLDAELAQLQTMGFIVPLVFMLVAAFLLNVVLTRIVSVQREQIAALKALGYTNAELAGHYSGWSVAIGLSGAAIGIAAGSWLGSGMIAIYNDFFRFPELLYRLDTGVALTGIGFSVAAAVLGAVGAVRRAVRLPPAEAMRPEPPARYRESWLERIGLRRLLTPPARMVLRNVSRHPIRTGTSVLGISLAAALLVVGTFFIDSVDELMYVQFTLMQRQDVTVTFVEPRGARAAFEVDRLPGVMTSETFRSVPARLRAGHRSRQLAIAGLPAAPELNRVYDVRRGAIRIPPDGLLLSKKLAELLAVERGDVVTVEVLEGRRPVRQAPVVDLVEEYMGTSAYMEMGTLRRLLRESDTVSGAYLRVDEPDADRLYGRLKTTPMVAGVALKDAAVESFWETLAQNLYVMIFFNLIFAGVIAFGVVYNAARIALSERSRELASLRVIGFTRQEISLILLGELAVVTVVAVPIGLLLGYGFAALIVMAFDTELYRFPLAVSVRTYVYAGMAVFLAAAVSGFAVRRKLDHLDLVAVLKSKE